MTDNHMGGAALMVGAAAGIITMILHPTARGLFAPETFPRAASMIMVSHGLALVGALFSFLGAVALYRRLDSPNRLALSALVLYGFASVAVMEAAALSGFVAPAIARSMLQAEPAEHEAWHMLFHFNGHLNQGFALVFTFASSIAIMLWSAAMVRERRISRGLGFCGLTAGGTIVLLLVSGHLRLNIHGFGMVVLAQAIWFTAAGALLWRTPAEGPGTSK